ncbi:glycosyltransferase family 2 protein [Dokdonia sinensis]|uniref:Glycosyltransferase family 2 protein n=1 Tax=Dokdonia sinensis TaxID=2479847 RepID=A0A3M0GGH8_9FLAO|nr:glycosyltransferase family 2 protein [Dokdonia sinensis]RMB64035.1 glycosyltransferase family 2 protein [Dokdonia sinensis]
MEIAVVILNWNGKELLERFLPDVVEFSSPLAQVYVADNASTDDSVAYVEDRFCKTCAERSRSSVIIIQNTRNGGYAGGYNEALRNIKADVFVLLNSDVQVTKGWLQPVIELFKSDANVAAAQPKIKDLKRPTHFEYAGAAGGFLDSLGYPYCRGRIFVHCEQDNGQYDDTIEVQWASGACLFVRSDVFWEVGGLDEDYFAHQEEIDLCWRIKNAGYSVKACGASEVFHLGGATLATADPKKSFYNFRNSLYSLVKNVKGLRILFILLIRLTLDGIAAIKFLLEGKPKHFAAILKAHFSFYANLPKLIKKRKHLSKSASYVHTLSIVKSHYLSGVKRYDQL